MVSTLFSCHLGTNCFWICAKTRRMRFEIEEFRATVQTIRGNCGARCSENGAGMSLTEPELEDLIACPQCDSLYELTASHARDGLRCDRCHTVLISATRWGDALILGLAVASVALVIAALNLPFIRIHRFFMSSDATLLDAVLAFSGPLLVVSLFAFALIVLLPLTRLALTVYVLGPVLLKRPRLPGAKRAYRLSEALRPWSMAEIFVLGVGVALFKISDLAKVELGPAFWMFVVLVILIVAQDRMICRWSVWKSLNR